MWFRQGNNKRRSENFYKILNLKNELIAYLNNNPLIKYKYFKSYAEKEFLKLNLDIIKNENYFKNIYYPWKKTNMAFKWYSIYENNKTK